jgi:hypothetical protein
MASWAQTLLHLRNFKLHTHTHTNTSKNPHPHTHPHTHPHPLTHTPTPTQTHTHTHTHPPTNTHPHTATHTRTHSHTPAHPHTHHPTHEHIQFKNKTKFEVITFSKLRRRFPCRNDSEVGGEWGGGRRHGLGWSGWGKREMAGACECGNEPPGSITCRFPALLKR